MARLHSPLLLRLVAGFALGSALTLGLGALANAPVPATGATLQVVS